MKYQTQIARPPVLLKDTACRYLCNKLTYRNSLLFIWKFVMITKWKIIVCSSSKLLSCFLSKFCTGLSTGDSCIQSFNYWLCKRIRRIHKFRSCINEWKCANSFKYSDKCSGNQQAWHKKTKWGIPPPFVYVILKHNRQHVLVRKK